MLQFFLNSVELTLKEVDLGGDQLHDFRLHLLVDLSLQFGRLNFLPFELFLNELCHEALETDTFLLEGCTELLESVAGEEFFDLRLEPLVYLVYYPALTAHQLCCQFSFESEQFGVEVLAPFD